MAKIKQAGGNVVYDENAPGKPVVRVDFESLHTNNENERYIDPIGEVSNPTPKGDMPLGGLRPHLESLPQLRELRIFGDAAISDAGLKHLEGLTGLNSLDLHSSSVRRLVVKEFAFGHGHTYPDFESQGLITKAGVDALQKKLPNVRITLYDSKNNQYIPTFPPREREK